MNIYPNRDLEELYLANQSVWEEVFDGDLTPYDALVYMQVDPDSDLWFHAEEMLHNHETPI